MVEVTENEKLNLLNDDLIVTCSYENIACMGILIDNYKVVQTSLASDELKKLNIKDLIEKEIERK